MSTMYSQHHYVSIARVVSVERSKYRMGSDPETALLTLSLRLADEFHADNAAFDRDRFLQAAGKRRRQQRNWQDAPHSCGATHDPSRVDCDDAIELQGIDQAMLDNAI